jgi:hypothetical protein
LKPLALAALQLDALRGNAGRQASAQTAVFVGLTLWPESSNDTFVHFSVLAIKSLLATLNAEPTRAESTVALQRDKPACDEQE